MFFGKRYKRRVFIPVSGILLMLLWLELTYTFVTPNLFPFLFNTVEAATGILDPNGDVGTNTGTRTTCGGTLYFDCLNDAVRDPTAPAGGDYVSYAGGNQTNSDLTTLTDVATATAVAVKVYHRETGTNMTLAASLVNSAGTVIAGPTNFTNRGTAQWDTINFGSLSLSQATVDGLRIRLTCTRSGGASGNRCEGYAAYGVLTYDPVINVTVSATSTQKNVVASTTNNHIGGAFSIVGNVGTRNITSITINETGTVDAQNNLKNIKLLYDMSTSTPFNCSLVSYSGNEIQFGSTDADGFSAANGSSVFTGSVQISATSTMCVYVVMDVQNGAASGETIEVQISAPDIDVVGSGSPVISPTSTVALSGTTVIEKTNLDQVNYHWRSDNGDEVTASSTTGGVENTPNTDFPKGVPQRLRLAISNEGTATSSATQYRLEFAQKVTTCSAVTEGSWTDVGATGGSFDMAVSPNLTEGADTTNIATTSGGVSDPNTTFVTPNGGVRDTSSQTGNITLSPTQFVELEYSISATSTLSDGASYCFRVSNAGTKIDTYTRYPEITIGADLTLSSLGSQVGNLVASTTNQYTGGAFVLINNTGDTDAVTSISITASGTSNVQTDFANIKLLYDLDTVAPYNCADESYGGGELWFGPVASAFNGSKKAVFTATTTINVTSTQALCLYVVLDVQGSISNGSTTEFSILSPSSDISASGASISPNSEISISGTTILAKQVLEQTGYHWRNNNGNESGATSATVGVENTILLDTAKETPYRLRLAVSNEGLATSSETAYRLEWAQKLTTCGAAAPWTRIDSAGDAWQMSPTANLTDGDNTTNIAVSSGGVSDPNVTFKVANGGVKDDNDTAASTTATSTEFIELEYSLSATTDAVQGATYCFRLTNAGTALDIYTNYAEAKIKLDTDFKIQRGETNMTGLTATITAGAQYDAPASSTRAFIRITNTQHTGGGPITTGNRFANDITAYISNPSNIGTSITFTRTSATVDTKIYWEIVEYRGAAGGENEIVVRRAEALSYISGNNTVTGSAISGVASGTKVVAFVTGQHNQDGGRNNYGAGLSTASFSTSTNQVTLTRGATGAISDVSYALVEFTGSNWRIQRVENTYSGAGATSTQSINSVNSLSRTFLHTQKRLSGSNINHADFGHEVWLSSIGQVSFLIDGAAGTPANHTSVAWVIENTQTLGSKVVVTRDNSTLGTSATANQFNYRNIGKTLSDLSITSLFVNNRSDESVRTWPEPILGITLASSTQYLLWRSDASANINFRTEVVEWPTAARKIQQNNFRFYVNNNAITPTDPWPVGGTNIGENTEMTATDTPMTQGDVIRIRMSLKVTAAAMPATLDSFTLQYGKRTTTCTAVTDWQNLGAISSTTAPWRGYNASSTDGDTLSSFLLTGSTVAGTYEEENDTTLNPNIAFPNDQIEYDWVVQHNLASDKSSYCFRMIEVNGNPFDDYNNYPVVRTVGYEPLITNWRWYDDATSTTPTSPLSISENVAPIEISNQNTIKLRMVLRESSGAAGVNTKFALQFSQQSDFSSDVTTVIATSTCVENSLWCYADGAGVDNATITAAVISNANTCTGGVGAGCGTHNESISTTTATLDQAAYSNAEFEFTIKNAGARANAVYFFRPYDVVNNEPVALYATSTYPSLVTEGAKLSFAVDGLPLGTTTAGVTTNASSSATSITFSPMLFDTDYIAAHRVTVNTNATEGYQVLKFAYQQLTNTYGDEIIPIPTTNAAPAGWSASCAAEAASCVGYHTTDAVLQGGSTRFAATDSYAGLHTTPAEVMFSSIPTIDIQDIVYRIKVSAEQPAGDYETDIVYLAIPTF
jgi:hypothetical protein